MLWYNKTLFSQAGLDPNKPPTTFAEILTDAKTIKKLGNGVSGFSFAGDCQGCLGFVMEPDLWAVNDQLIQGPIGHQTITIENNGPLKQLLTLYQQLWSQKLVPANARPTTARPGATTSRPARSASCPAPTASTR